MTMTITITHEGLFSSKHKDQSYGQVMAGYV